MKSRRLRESGKSGLDLIEEAAHQLRIASAVTLLTYYLGAIPFVLGFLYFWTDMSRSPFAYQHLAEASLATALLFIWMKFCQALFARRMRAQVAAEPMPHWNGRQSARVFLTQAVIQPWGLFMIPLALILTLPFAWVYAFYQNVTALADNDANGVSKLIQRSWKQASLWPGQNHIGLGIGLVFALGVCLNWALVLLSLPSLLKMLFGIESVFSRNPAAMLNTSFLAAILGITYLCVDPILKTLYALRCFYGESLQSGEDLKSDLKRFALSPLAILLVIVLSVASGATARAAQSQKMSSEELDRQIDHVIHESKYAWRMPRDQAARPESEKGVITRFAEKIVRLAAQAARTMRGWVEELFRKLMNLGPTSDANGRSSGWLSSSLLLYALLAAALSALAIVLLRASRGRKQRIGAVAAQAIQRLPDLADENVAADQLPEDGWTRLARELLESGEFRLAMRAFYLASLAHLAERNLIGIARSKSNRDYENELRRRGHSVASLLPVFGENLSMFERIWYGMHDVNYELVQQFARNVDKIKAAA